MKKHSLALPAALLLTGSMLSGADLLTVNRNGSKTTITTEFSPSWRLVQSLHTNGNNKHMNFSGNCLQKGKKLVYIQAGGDDATPWHFNSTYIGANHGDSIASAVIFTAPHSFTKKDCGSFLTDSKNRRFYIVKIESPTVIWVLSDNFSKDKDVWRFIRPSSKFPLKSASGKEFREFTVQMRQLYSPVRINSRVYKADGQPVADKGSFKCKIFTVEEEYDIIGTDTILQHVLANKGKQVAFNARGLKKVLTQKIRYDFYPNGSCIITHDVEFFRDVRLGYMGFQQAYQLNKGSYAKHLYYIPKTIPYTAYGETWDFASMEDYTRPITNSIYLTKAHCEDPANPPERYIQYIQESKNSPDVGFAVGYSLLEGVTVPAERVKNNGIYLFLYRSHKTYPHAIDGKGIPRIKAGTKFHAVGYRQFFDPAKGYFHNTQGEYDLVYVDFHAPVEEKVITLPESLANKKYSVLESSKTVSFTNVKNKFTFKSTGKYGYCVLKFE